MPLFAENSHIPLILLSGSIWGGQGKSNKVGENTALLNIG